MCRSPGCGGLFGGGGARGITGDRAQVWGGQAPLRAETEASILVSAMLLISYNAGWHVTKSI